MPRPTYTGIKRSFADLKPGDFLADAHYSGYLTDAIQERIIEPIALSTPLVIEGDLSNFLDVIAAQAMQEDWAHSKHRYINKLVMVLQPLYREHGWLVGWSYDGRILRLAKLLPE